MFERAPHDRGTGAAAGDWEEWKRGEEIGIVCVCERNGTGHTRREALFHGAHVDAREVLVQGHAHQRGARPTHVAGSLARHPLRTALGHARAVGARGIVSRANAAGVRARAATPYARAVHAAVVCSAGVARAAAVLSRGAVGRAGAVEARVTARAHAALVGLLDATPHTRAVHAAIVRGVGVARAAAVSARSPAASKGAQKQKKAQR